jgi:hypothetical protein
MSCLISTACALQPGDTRRALPGGTDTLGFALLVLHI